MLAGVGVAAALALAAALTALLATDRAADTTVAAPEQEETAYLSDLRWESADTGWVALADDNLPKLDTSFLNSPITISGRSYPKGLGTFPLSEIAYALDGKYDRFQAEVGVDDAVPPGKGSVVFKAFLDGIQVYDSGLVTSGQAAVQVSFPLAGASRLKLLVEDAGDGASFDYADWADARLIGPALRNAISASASAVLESRREDRKRQQSQDWGAVYERSGQELQAVSSAFEGKLPSAETRATFDPERNLIVLANDKLALTLGYGGDRHGLLNVLSLETRQLIATDTTPSLAVGDSPSVMLSEQTTRASENGYRFRRVTDPVLGPGTEIEADFALGQNGGVVVPRIALFDGTSYLTYQLELRDVAEGTAVSRFAFFSPEGSGRFVVGEDAGYVTDYSLIRRSDVADDSVLRRELVGLGKPVLLYDRGRSQRIVMAILDEVSDPAQFSVRMDTGKVTARLGFEYSLPNDVRGTRVLASPRLFFQPSFDSALKEATHSYMTAMAALYPPPSIPSWVKYQWGTWYAFGMGYDEQTIKDQVEYIERNLADLGTWSILLDAGWYVAEGKPGSSWDNVDAAKFPNGLRPLVDYVHSKGMKVILYFSAPYLDDREQEGDWLGLRGFIEEHPDWVIRLQSDNTGASYVYDFTNPALVEYMHSLIARFFRDYDVDGIKIDGLGQAEGEQLAQEERDTFGDVNKIRMFTMDVYRLVWEEATKAGKDAYVESGWAVPAYAGQYAHTFRYGDEFPAMEHRYPAGGLIEHIDYAALQKRVIGQRPNMGMVWGGPESQEMIRQWFEAALAMGTQMTVSTDLTRISSRDLSALRSVLVPYNAFQGDTYFVGLPSPTSFATTVDGITYLGVVNRGAEFGQRSLRLSDYGLVDGSDYLAYDVSAGAYFKAKGTLQVNVPGPGFREYVLRGTPGLVWTDSSTETDLHDDTLNVTARGPSGTPGIMQIYAPHLSGVRLDGKDLTRSTTPRVDESYSYDASTGVLRLRYRHNKPREIEVRY